MIPMGRPLLPSAEKLLPYLKRIDEKRWYSNQGYLVREYEERIGQHFGCHAAAVSSGTSGLIASLLAQDMSGELFMPAWSFVATANAAVATGCTPRFVDVDEDTWTPEFADIPVAPFGGPVNYEDAVVIDAAAGFDAYATGQAPLGNTPVVISTHCTKAFSTGEGGLVLSRDENIIKEIKEIINHGLGLDRSVSRAGFNGKMSEYHAAVGLAELDSWALKRNKWLDMKRKYVQALGSLAHTTPLSSLSWIGSTFCVRLVGKNAELVRQYLQDNDVMSRKIWGDGIHKYEAYRDYEQDPLLVTDTLAKEVVFVPFSIDTTDAELDKIASLFEKIVPCV